VTQYSLEQAAKDLEKITEPDERVFTKESFRAHALPLMDTIANEGFFADAVVIVEGFGDMGVLWAMQDILKMDWPSLGIAIIPARGKNNIDRPVVIFRGFQIPTYFIFDADSRYKGKKEEQETINRNKRYLKLAGAKEEEFPSTQVHETWSCFEDEIESYLKSELEETVFNPIREETARELGYDKPSNVLKNLDGSEKFIQKVYSLGKALPVLEDIITQITKLSRR
jgi:predicted ATP-dependent endonuclease of OLD family